MSSTFTITDDVTVPLDAEVHVFGTPYHGLVENGTLTLPNAATMAISQPAGGSTYVVRVPGVAPVSRTPAEAAADAAAGRQWLDYGILAGDWQKLYGLQLGPLGWIYCSEADNKRWWIKLTSASSITGNSQTFTFSVKLFGAIGGTPEEYTRSVTVTDIGQSTPTVTFHSGIETGTGLYDYTVNTYTLHLEDTRPDGAVAVIGLRNSDPLKLLNWTPAWLAGEPMSMGFLAVTVSDGPSGPVVSVSVLHTRAESLGTLVSTEGTYHSTDRIIAVWFDGDTPKPVKVSYYFPDAYCYKPATGFSCPGGTYNETCDSVATAVITLSWGSVVATYECNGEWHRTAEMWCSSPVDPSYSLGSGSGSGSFTWEGSLVSGSNVYASGDAQVAGSRLWSNIWIMGFWQGSSLLTSSHPNAYHGNGVLHASTPNGDPGSSASGDKVWWALKRLNNKQFGILGMRYPHDTDPQGGDPYAAWSQTNDMVWLGGFTPAGKDSLQGNLGVHANIVPKGAVHPVTGVPVLRADATPVCYI